LEREKYKNKRRIKSSADGGKKNHYLFCFDLVLGLNLVY
jgi:hypothetical protein